MAPRSGTLSDTRSCPLGNLNFSTIRIRSSRVEDFGKRRGINFSVKTSKNEVESSEPTNLAIVVFIDFHSGQINGNSRLKDICCNICILITVYETFTVDIVQQSSDEGYDRRISSLSIKIEASCVFRPNLLLCEAIAKHRTVFRGRY